MKLYHENARDNVASILSGGFRDGGNADRPTVLNGGRLPLRGVETFDKFEKRCRGICETSDAPIDLGG